MTFLVNDFPLVSPLRASCTYDQGALFPEDGLLAADFPTRTIEQMTLFASAAMQYLFPPIEMVGSFVHCIAGMCQKRNACDHFSVTLTNHKMTFSFED